MDSLGHQLTVLLIGKRLNKDFIVFSYSKITGIKSISLMPSELWPYACVSKNAETIVELKKEHFIGFLDYRYSPYHCCAVSVSLDEENEVLICREAPLVS